MVLYLNPTLQGCYQVLKSCDLGYFFARLSAPQSPVNPRILPEADVDLIVPTAPRAARVGVRGSAPMRRGAAPYGNGCEQISGHSHLISQCNLSPYLDLRAAFYTTF